MKLFDFIDECNRREATMFVRCDCGSRWVVAYAGDVGVAMTPAARREFADCADLVVKKSGVDAVIKVSRLPADRRDRANDSAHQLLNAALGICPLADYMRWFESASEI